jgi:hypothetical protein
LLKLPPWNSTVIIVPHSGSDLNQLDLIVTIVMREELVSLYRESHSNNGCWSRDDAELLGK